MCHVPPPPTPPDSQAEVAMREMMWVRLGKQRPQPDILHSKHENTHMSNTQRKLSLDISVEEKNENSKHSTHMSWTPMRYDHKALISVSVSKDNHCTFPINEPMKTWWWRLYEQMLQHQEWPLFFFFPLSDPSIHQPLTHAGPTAPSLSSSLSHTHLHTDTIIILTLTCTETSHPSSGWKPNATIPRWRLRRVHRCGAYGTLAHGQTGTPEVRRLCLYWRPFPSKDRKGTLTLWSQPPAAYLLTVFCFHTEIWKISIILHVNKPSFSKSRII